MVTYFFGELKIVISLQFGNTDTDTDMYDVNKMSIWPLLSGSSFTRFDV